jgi:hypothetical protein
MNDFDEFEPAVRRAVERLDELVVEQERRRAKRIEETGPANNCIKREAVEVFELDGVECWIVKNYMWDVFDDMSKNGLLKHNPEVGYNGYACFKTKPVIEPGNRGILSYVPVHGGITYVCHDEVGSVYGFDTAHHNSGDYPNRDPEWIKNQILLMVLAIKMAATIEPAYLDADGDNEKRAALVQPLLELSDGPNMNVMLNLLAGEL